MSKARAIAVKILFVGPQGAGKSTQAKLLSEFLNIPSISTGDIFRELSTADNELGKKIKEIMTSGNLVDDQTTSEIVKERLQKPDCQNGFIFDGYPRTIKQIEYFDPGFNRVLYLKFDDEQARKRLLERARADDTPQLIDQRLKLYHELTNPILEYYKNKGILVTIDADSSIDVIQEKIREAVNGQAAN